MPNTIYKLFHSQTLLSPQTGKPYKTILGAYKCLKVMRKSMDIPKINGKYLILESQVRIWNIACKLVSGK